MTFETKVVLIFFSKLFCQQLRFRQDSIEPQGLVRVDNKIQCRGQKIDVYSLGLHLDCLEFYVYKKVD